MNGGVPRLHIAVPLGLPETSSNSDPLVICSKRLAEDQLNATERKTRTKKELTFIPSN